jgi:hypothetical protein
MRHEEIAAIRQSVDAGNDVSFVPGQLLERVDGDGQFFVGHDAPPICFREAHNAITRVGYPNRDRRLKPGEIFDTGSSVPSPQWFEIETNNRRTWQWGASTLSVKNHGPAARAH